MLYLQHIFTFCTKFGCIRDTFFLICQNSCTKQISPATKQLADLYELKGLMNGTAIWEGREDCFYACS